MSGGGNLMLAPQGFPKFSHSEGEYPKESSQLLKLKAGLLRQKSRNDRFGFTLAEVLVTLGIIGVVSAMTVPTLMQNYQRKSYVTQLHKVYNELSQALLQYQTDRNALNLKEAGINSNDSVINFYRTYFKNVKECDSMSECFADTYRKMDGTVTAEWSNNYTSFVLPSGASVRPVYSLEGNKIMNIAVDVNGTAGPNIVGRDLFGLYVYNNSLIDETPPDESSNAPLTKEQRDELFNSSCIKTTSVNGCFGKILNDNWEMTY